MVAAKAIDLADRSFNGVHCEQLFSPNFITHITELHSTLETRATVVERYAFQSVSTTPYQREKEQIDNVLLYKSDQFYFLKDRPPAELPI